jgi:dTDP-L-rhamnose 4-epimerase
MSIYGEGAYRCARCGPLTSAFRTDARLTAKRWEMACPSCGADAVAVPTPEAKPLAPSSIYAITKRDQEEMCLCIGQAYGLPSVALRFFNVYGERQALSNPYTGVAAIFASRLLNSQPPLIYEDGRQSRDFVHVSDVIQAVLLAIQKPDADYQALNVGTGRAISVSDVAVVLAKSLGRAIPPKVSGSFRAGDIRHCVADITKITAALGYRPRVSFEQGMDRLTAWLLSQRPRDRTAQAARQLTARGLVR